MPSLTVRNIPDEVHRALRVLKVTEIFYSLQGESTWAGWPTVFVRLTGCPLRCRYCDSAYAFRGGRTLDFEAIAAEMAQYRCQRVCVTGGEPLAQKQSLAFLTFLCDADCTVSLETSGALSIAAVDPRVARILDVKAPGSKQAQKMYWPNLDDLKAGDEIKFVLYDRADYEWARSLLHTHPVFDRLPVLFSPVWEALPAATLAQWILEDSLKVRLQIQLHKVLWGDRRGV